MTQQKIIELIRKVKALADKGVSGESVSAKEKLKRLCDKYNISESDLHDLDEKNDYILLFRDKNERELLLNIVCMILDVPTFKWNENKSCAKMKLTEFQYRDIISAFEYYQKMYDDYKRYLIQGMLARNAVGYVPKPQTYTQENVNQPDIPHMTSQDDTVEETTDDASLNEESGSLGDSKKKKKKKKNYEEVESLIDPIKLMKVAVALEKKPWVKMDPNKKLIEEVSDGMI
jgi:hypothetical protein